MKKIYFSNDILYYFGNPAGYQEGEQVVIDAMFQREELLHYLADQEGKEVIIQEGVFDSLLKYGAGQSPSPNAGTGVTFHKSDDRESGQGIKIPRLELRIYRLKPERPVLMRFAGLTEREKRGFGMPERWEYDQIYEGKVPNFDLEEIWDSFSRKDIGGHPLSISDVAELSCDGVSHFFYVDRTCFKEIELK